MGNQKKWAGFVQADRPSGARRESADYRITFSLNVVTETDNAIIRPLNMVAFAKHQIVLALVDIGIALGIQVFIRKTCGLCQP